MIHLYSGQWKLLLGVDVSLYWRGEKPIGKRRRFWCKLSDKIEGLSNVLHTSEPRCLLAGFCFCSPLHNVRQGVKLWKCWVPHCAGAWCLCSTLCCCLVPTLCSCLVLVCHIVLLFVSHIVFLLGACMPHCVAAWCLWICSTCKISVISLEVVSQRLIRRHVVGYCFEFTKTQLEGSLNECYLFKLPLVLWQFTVNVSCFTVF